MKFIVEGTQEFKCPAGNVCTTHKDICRPNCGDDPSKPVVPSKCGICEASVNSLFTCTSETTFTFCYGKNVPFEESAGTCDTGFVCDVTNPQVCSPEGSVEPSCVTDLSEIPEFPSDSSTMCPGTTSTTTTVEPTTTTTVEPTTTTTTPEPTTTTTTPEPTTTTTTPEPTTTTTLSPEDQELYQTCYDNPDAQFVATGISCRS